MVGDVHGVYMQKLGKVGPLKKFLTHYLVLSPSLLFVDIVSSLAFCFACIFVFNVLQLYFCLIHDLIVNFLVPLDVNI